jgi:hypothetical protein
MRLVDISLVSVLLKYGLVQFFCGVDVESVLVLLTTESREGNINKTTLECLGIDKKLKASAKIGATKTTNVWGVQQHSIFYQ